MDECRKLLLVLVEVKKNVRNLFRVIFFRREGGWGWKMRQIACVSTTVIANEALY